MKPKVGNRTKKKDLVALHFVDESGTDKIDDFVNTLEELGLTLDKSGNILTLKTKDGRWLMKENPYSGTIKFNSQELYNTILMELYRPDQHDYGMFYRILKLNRMIGALNGTSSMEELIDGIYEIVMYVENSKELLSNVRNPRFHEQFLLDQVSYLRSVFDSKNVNQLKTIYFQKLKCSLKELTDSYKFSEKITKELEDIPDEVDTNALKKIEKLVEKNLKNYNPEMDTFAPWDKIQEVHRKYQQKVDMIERYVEICKKLERINFIIYSSPKS